jgi:hypothetical protein
MFNGNLYGLVITMLTFVIAVILTMRQVEQTGVHFELTIRPVTTIRQEGDILPTKQGPLNADGRRNSGTAIREVAKRPHQGEP